MSYKDNQPANRNPLYNTSFKLVIPRLPITTYFVSKVNVPGVSVGAADQGTTFATIPQPGDHMNFEERITAEFLVDEDLVNWKEIFEWMKLIGMPSEPLPSNVSESELVSDIYILATTNSLLANKRIVFKDAFPVELSGLDFDSTTQDSTPLTASVTFEFCLFNVEELSADKPC